ncbi:MAG: N-acetylmuramoyl-L-alanine amidase [Myxococcales bacterium]|nr:N-acetylmuramoyl-L-alanine amidase [Myxococcales bacterium]
MSTDGLLLLACALGLAGDAHAHPAPLALPDGEATHTRPPGWELLSHPHGPADLDGPAPEPLHVEPEYPLAVAFEPAYSGNYTEDGIEAYKWIVVHTMQGSYAGTISWFKNPDAVVSTQYVMRSSDGEVTQMVRDQDRAYHVGSSNRFALGIEHEGYIDDPAKWYTWATYGSSALLTRWLTIKHAIPVDREHIAGHVELPDQSHTDPGSGWNWTLYMALIREVVPPGEIHGVVVDRGAACTLTAGADTWLKKTAMPTDTLTADELCPVDAGAELTYWHARPDIDGHHRLVMPPGEGPCAGTDLEADAYVIAADWSALCPPSNLAAAGASVRLDGGAAVEPGPAGDFIFTAAQGPHTVDAHADGLYEPASEPVALAVYPGARLVIALDPVPAPDPTGDPSDTGDPTDPTDPTADPTTPMTSITSASDADGGDAGGLTGGGDDGGLTGGSDASPTDPGGPGSDGGAHGLPALPDSYGADDDAAGCACRSTGSNLRALLLPSLIFCLRRRRR